jgi:Flp pilus assembly protein TadD
MLETHVTTLHRAGELDQVEALYPRLIEMTAKAFGERHTNVLMVRNNQVQLLMARGKRDDAIAAMRAIVDTYTAIGGPLTTGHLTALHNLGMVLNLSGRFADAERRVRCAAPTIRRAR